MNYGLPYKGSKSKIADFVLGNLPKANVLVDLFSGGCAITHKALISGKYERIIANDVLEDVPKLFKDACEGKYANEQRWISREDFVRLKDKDAYVRLCWSFGNDQRSYLYSRWLEPWKKALHYARMFGDTSLLAQMGIDGDGSRKDVREHDDEYKRKYIEWYKRTHQDAPDSIRYTCQLESLQSLQSLERLERLERLQISSLDYRVFAIPQGAVVYCDPPYKGTGEYNCRKDSVKFNHDEFWSWVREQDELVIVSEYNAPEDFVSVAEKVRCSTLSATNNNLRVLEKLFVHQSKLDEYKQRMKQGCTNLIKSKKSI